MQFRLVLALIAVLALSAGAVAQNKTLVRVPDLSVFNDGNEMIGALSALGLNGRITAMAAPSPDFEGKFGQLPIAGSFLTPGGDVFIFKYGKYVPPETTTAAKPAGTGSTPDSGMEAMIAGADSEFVGTYAGRMKPDGGPEQAITVAIANNGGWSVIVDVPDGMIGTPRVGNGESIAMENGALVYRLKGNNYETTLSIKVNGNDLAGILEVTLGAGDFARKTTSTLSATRTQ